MDTDREANTGEKYPPDFEDDTERTCPPGSEEDTVRDDPDEEWDEEEEAAEEERDDETEPTALPSVRPRSRPDFGCIGALIIVLAVVSFFVWVLVSAIVHVVKEDREAELRRWQAADTYRRSVERRSSGGSSSGRSSYGSSSSGGSSSYGSSGSGYKSKRSGGSNKKDEYNAADFGNPEDFYDEHYDDFFDYYDAEDYWNEYN